MTKKYYIVKLDSYDGDGSSLIVNAGESGCMYVVLCVEGKSADIIDWGYETVGELLDAWNNVEFENVEEYR